LFCFVIRYLDVVGYIPATGMLLQLLGWRCIESVLFACPIHENDQTWTFTWI